MSEFLGIAVTTGHTCGAACWHAREEVCRCSCGGKNHGILNRGGDQPGRTAKIGGKMYEMVEVGAYHQIEGRRMEEIRRIDWRWFYDPKGPYLTKSAGASQLKNWQELAAFQEPDELGRLDCYILWRQVGAD